MKKFKTKRKNNKLIIWIIFIFFLVIFLYFSFQKLSKNYDSVINYLLSKSFVLKEKDFSLFNKKTLKIDYNLLPYYFYEMDFNSQEDDELIYLYNTHDEEKYRDNMSIIDGTKLLKENLNKIGIKALVEEKKVSSLLETGLSHYNISRDLLVNTMKEHPSIKYYIDIHRDSISKTTIEINNKKYAKILFVLGYDNPKCQDNELIVNKMNDYLNEKYPGLSKGILKKSGKDVDGVYNQDLSPNVLLIEIGGIENNFEEVNNSTEILALMLYHLLGEYK